MSQPAQSTERIARVSRELSDMSGDVEQLESVLSRLFDAETAVDTPVRSNGAISQDALRDLQKLDYLRQALGDLSRFLDGLVENDLSLTKTPITHMSEFSLKAVGARVVLGAPATAETEPLEQHGQVSLF